VPYAINKSNQQGFTLVEIIVATTIFAIVGTAMTVLFDYTLKINRRTEAMRQATQAVRTFAEGLVKQIRNGQIYYGVINGTDTEDVANGPCGAGSVQGGGQRLHYYSQKENKIRFINTEGEDVCVYLANKSGSNLDYVGDGNYGGNSLAIEKRTTGVNIKEKLNPENIAVENLAMFIRPVCDPYGECSDGYSSQLPRIQPMAQISMKIIATLPTKESVTVYYQTAVSSNLYDIPY
jgi:prepilin-type N-terminal cleavage/methylation domain-containing protein